MKPVNRRRFLGAASATGIALLAGCAGGGSDTGSTPSAVRTTFPDPTDGPIAAFEVPSVDSDVESVMYGEEYSATVTVENIGEAAGRFWGELVERRGPGWVPIDTLEFDVNPGKSVSEVCTWQPSRVGTMSYGVLEVQTDRMLAQWEIVVEAPELDIGTTFTDPAGWAMSIEEVELTSSFEAINEKGEEVTAEAPRDKQWALVHLRVQNPSNDPQFVPSEDDLELLVNKQQVPDVELVEVGKYDPYVNPTQQDGYYSGPTEMLPGVVETGWILFAVPDDVSSEAIEVVVYWDEMGVRITWK